MNWLEGIATVTPFRKYSQCGEEAILGYILAHIGKSEGGYLIDLGASDGYSNSNSRWLLESMGWTGLLLDGQDMGNPEVKQAWITLDNVSKLIRDDYDRNARICDLLLIDLDGNDYWILKEILASERPALIIAEINGSIQQDTPQTIPYNSVHEFHDTDHFGMNLPALVRVGKDHGYTLVHVQSNINGFLLRDDLLPGPPPEIKFQRIQGHPHQPNAAWTLL